MKYSDVAGDFAAQKEVHDNYPTDMLLARQLNAIAGELDSISWALRELLKAKLGERKNTHGPRANSKR